ncbi:sorbitol dehydrogenase [Diplodia corticola]|uniref:Sorbitol dehydrogenase n=1 Tax=Diplodia corticola TaxID=236234 RepID=A0A1J9QZC3_9PEZI|nr:sorbitol dehydrogenase [Diplodia corticola]OJD33330.1 sorbitol dehydrogenase [Diplodia corticola]
MLDAIKKLTATTGSTSALMKAVRFHGQRDLRLDHIPEPQVAKGQVKLKPAWVGICGSDLHEYMGGASICPTTPHPITGETVPLTFGHEFSAVVEEVGEGVTDFAPGDRVCVQPIIYDGDCAACEEGLINCCYKNGFIGLSGWGGGLAEHIVTPQSCLYKLPENVSLEIGALVEPLAVGWHAVNISPFDPATTPSVLVLGGGPIGLAVIQALRARGAAQIIVSEVSPRRKAFARRFGAHHVLDPAADDVPARCRELSPGGGVHVAYDCAGAQAGLDAAVHAVRARGTVVNIAIWERRCSLFPSDFCFKERSYMGVATYQAGDFRAVLDAISEGRLTPGEMITKRIELDEVEAEGFKTLIEDKDNQVKVLVRANRLGGESKL